MARRHVHRRAIHKAHKAKVHKSRVHKAKAEHRAKDFHVGHKGGTHERTVNAPKTW